MSKITRCTWPGCRVLTLKGMCDRHRADETGMAPIHAGIAVTSTDTLVAHAHRRCRHFAQGGGAGQSISSLILKDRVGSFSRTAAANEQSKSSE